jgi:N-acetylglucosamine-6-phosphate deacetylase
MDARLKIFNGRILTPHRLIADGTVVVMGERIAEVSEGNVEVPGALEIDAQGRYIAPGFIDIHVHGGGGYDFMDGSETAFLKVAELHARYGTTSMVPTSLSSDKASVLQTLSAYAAADGKNTRGAQFLGMHLEGPYFAMNQRGAQDARYIRNPDPEEYKDIIKASWRPWRIVMPSMKRSRKHLRTAIPSSPTFTRACRVSPAGMLSGMPA